jgi:hypothetical protein
MPDELVVPQPSLRVNGLAYGAQDLERGQVVLVGEGFPEFHQGPGVDVRKLFFFVAGQNAIVFVPAKFLQVSLIFVGKNRAYLSGAT